MLLLLLLEQLLLGRCQLLQSRMRVRRRAGGNAAHHSRIDLSAWSSAAHGASAELMRHSTGGAWLTRVLGHALRHRVAGNSWMSHGRGVAREVGSHASRHHFQD
jgi:hypothetical protein